MSGYKVDTHKYTTTHSLDVFKPEDTAPIGCILYFHGGAWVSGSSFHSFEMAVTLAQRGYIVVCPNYTLTQSPKIKAVRNIVLYVLLLIPAGFYTVSRCTKPLTKKMLAFLSLVLVILILFELSTRVSEPSISAYPEHFQDAQKALDWTFDNISMASKELFVMGHSAGAHIAALLINTTNQSVSGVILLSGVYMYDYMNHPLLALLLSEVFHDRKDAFPEFHVKKGLPPHLLCSATFDYGLQKQARKYTRMLQDKDVVASHILFRKNNHYSIRRQWDMSNNHILSSVLSFMRTASNIKKYP